MTAPSGPAQDGPITAPPISLHSWLLMLLLLSVLWGGSFFFIAIAVREWPPLSIVLPLVLLLEAPPLASLEVSGALLGLATL